MLQRLLHRLEREAFIPSAIAIVISPVYFIRRGLYTTIRRLAPGVTGSVLDFGCGSKPYESLFVNATSYIGVDIPVSGHNHAKSRIDVFYDGRTLPFADDQFDSAVSFEVFEHVFNIDEVLAELRRVLRPGAQLLISAPFAWDEHEAPYDFARYTSYGIRDVLERNGFAVVHQHKTTTYVQAVCQIFIDYLRRYVFPQNRIASRIFQLLFIFPLNLLTIMANELFPKRYEFYSNNVVVARVQK